MCMEACTNAFSRYIKSERDLSCLHRDVADESRMGHVRVALLQVLKNMPQLLLFES